MSIRKSYITEINFFEIIFIFKSKVYKKRVHQVLAIF